jgi:type I restriction-modification system DNA methylase subunit
VTARQNHLFSDHDAARYGNGGPYEPLILPKFLAEAAADYRLRDPQQAQAHDILKRWADLEEQGKLRRMTETNLEGEFLTDVFSNALGYTLFSENKEQWHLWPKYSLPGGEADAAIGQFDENTPGPPVVLMELKGPTVNIDRDRFRGRTPVQQCWDYLNAVAECPWGVVCNYVGFRLYHRGKTPRRFVHFALRDLRDPQRFAEFYCLFSRGGLLPGLLGHPPRAEVLLRQTDERQREVGDELYRRYQDQRLALIRHLREPPHEKSLDAAIHAAQVLLDRILFIAFCEDRGLLPAKSIETAWRDVGAFSLAVNPRWQRFRDLFRSIDRGNAKFDINAFNGGLFRLDPEVDYLELDDRWTDFFRDIGAYDFRGEVNVDVLGRLFERSISDLEIVRFDPEAALAPPPRTAVGKRKRSGVYYTPQHVTRYIVEHTLGPCLEERFAAAAAELGLPPDASPDICGLERWAELQRARLAALAALRVCDPACGSGAFLIQALEYLEAAYNQILDELCSCEADAGDWSPQKVKDTILRENLFGVDLLEEGVEITRLALWIRTAQRGRTLADLSDNIRCGNSLVDDPQVDPRAFDWRAAFPRVFAQGGFDCVISNPPYVKLQNFRRREPRAAAFLVQRYRAAQTGNFDLYLPFVERGLELLKPDGRMGLIAPNVWLYNEYGRGLRELVAQRHALDRFVDFKSHQVFDDATTYTALQFFSARPRKNIAVADAPDGNLSNLDFRRVGYAGLAEGPWALLGKAEQKIIDKMRERGTTLADATAQIFQGLITSADAVYHLVKLGPGRYYSHALRGDVELDDELMKPLVSGEDAIPFAAPRTDKYLLFPYLVGEDECRLYTEAEMKRFRRCWKYLRENEKTLRAREHGKMDHDRWYGYVYPKNLDKHMQRKLLIPRLLRFLFAAYDEHGAVYLDNVDVGGVIPKRTSDPWYLLGVLNTPVLDFVWRKTAKLFRGGYHSANKQFIAPLPMPAGRGGKPVAELARKLAELYGRAAELRRGVCRRLAVDLAPAALVPVPPELVAVPRKLENLETLPLPELLTEVEKFAKRKFKPSERAQWDGYLSGQQTSLAAVLREIDDARAELNARVCRLFELTDEEAAHIAAETAVGQKNA